MDSAACRFVHNGLCYVDLELQMFMQPQICEGAANLFQIGRKSLYLCECQYWDLFSNSIISTETVFYLSIAVSVTCYIQFLTPLENSRCPLSIIMSERKSKLQTIYPKFQIVVVSIRLHSRINLLLSPQPGWRKLAEQRDPHLEPNIRVLDYPPEPQTFSYV